MITKQDLTHLLRDACDLEEGYMRFLTDYTQKYFDWTGFEHMKVMEAKRLLERLAKESERHKRMCEDMISWVSERKEDEF
jgi:rubrerythrin